MHPIPEAHAHKSSHELIDKSFSFDLAVFFGNKIKYLAVQVNLTLGRFSTGYKSGKPVMDRWENFVNSQVRVLIFVGP